MIRLIDILLELSYTQLFNKTPLQYRDSARDVRVRLKTVSPKGTYHYQSTTSKNSNVHNQWIKPRVGRQLKGLNDQVLVWCDCENFTYENEWLLWKNNSSHVVNSNGQPLRVRNPEQLPKLCKHLVAVMEDLKNRL